MAGEQEEGPVPPLPGTGDDALVARVNHRYAACFEDRTNVGRNRRLRPRFGRDVHELERSLAEPLA